MAYSFQTFSLNQILTSAQVNQIEANIRDHIHGSSGVQATLNTPTLNTPVLDSLGTIQAYTYQIGEGIFDEKSLDTSSQTSSPTGVAFSSDGTKCYVIDFVSSDVFQYTLSTAWDISTGSYASKSLDCSTQVSNSFDLAFSSDGTKCYVIGTNNTVFQYTLSTAWDISTGSYASKSMSAATQETICTGLDFSSDGTKCYVIGQTNDTVFQYTLSTAWDISTGSYASKSMSVTSEDGSPTSVRFNDDGTRCYFCGAANDSMYQYELRTAWDISTGRYAGKSMGAGGQSSPSGFAFSSDGTKCYVTGSTGVDGVYQYNLTVLRIT